LESSLVEPLVIDYQVSFPRKAASDEGHRGVTCIEIYMLIQANTQLKFLCHLRTRKYLGSCWKNSQCRLPFLGSGAKDLLKECKRLHQLRDVLYFRKVSSAFVYLMEGLRMRPRLKGPFQSLVNFQ